MDQDVARQIEALRELLEGHFGRDEGFEREIYGALTAIRAEGAQLRQDFEVFKSRYEAHQARWRIKLDPEEGGMPPAAQHIVLNGAMKKISLVSAGASTTVAAAFWVLQMIYDAWKAK